MYCTRKLLRSTAAALTKHSETSALRGAVNRSFPLACSLVRIIALPGRCRLRYQVGVVDTHNGQSGRAHSPKKMDNTSSSPLPPTPVAFSWLQYENTLEPSILWCNCLLVKCQISYVQNISQVLYTTLSRKLKNICMLIPNPNDIFLFGDRVVSV